MIKISRSEQFIMYYWTGCNWSTKKADAKLFDSIEAAQAEMSRKRIEYTVSYS